MGMEAVTQKQGAGQLQNFFQITITAACKCGSRPTTLTDSNLAPWFTAGATSP